MNRSVAVLEMELPLASVASSTPSMYKRIVEPS